MHADYLDHSFASDNYSGVHPEVLDAIARVNTGHASSYGNDPETARLGEVMRARFGEDARVFPVFTGTGANVTALQAITPRWGAVICASGAHINTDECGAPERLAGLKLLPVPTPDGKLTPELIDVEAWGFDFEHRATPSVVSITQSTELGTLYTQAEITAIVEHAHAKGMRVHVDGARLANAAAALETDLGDLTTRLGVDIVSLGATKNGALGAEAIIARDDETARSLVFLRKMNAQLASKMRFVSAQLTALYEGELWRQSAARANAMAARLRAAVEDAPGIAFTTATEANSLFASLPAGVADRLRRDFAFYDWDEARGEVRWMTSFDTTPAHVDAFAEAIRRECAAAHEASAAPAPSHASAGAAPAPRGPLDAA